MMKICLSTAEAAIGEAKEVVLVKGLPPMSISVVDDEAHLVAFCRMDGTPIGATDLAHRAATTTVMFTARGPVAGERFKAVAADPLEKGRHGIGGGVLLRDAQGDVIGAVGVSGGTPEEEALVAQAAASAIAG